MLIRSAPVAALCRKCRPQNLHLDRTSSTSPLPPLVPISPTLSTPPAPRSLATACNTVCTDGGGSCWSWSACWISATAWYAKQVIERHGTILSLWMGQLIQLKFRSGPDSDAHLQSWNITANKAIPLLSSAQDFVNKINNYLHMNNWACHDHC